MGDRLQRSLRGLHAALSRGHAGARLCIVQYHQQLAGRNHVARLHIDGLDAGRDRAVEFVIASGSTRPLVLIVLTRGRRAAGKA